MFLRQTPLIIIPFLTRTRGTASLIILGIRIGRLATGLSLRAGSTIGSHG